MECVVQENGVDDDSKDIGIRNWKNVALSREAWDKQIRNALALGELLRQL
jgi:hypothetical protein